MLYHEAVNIQCVFVHSMCLCSIPCVQVCAWMRSAVYVLYACNSIASVFYARLYTCVHIHSMCMFNVVCTHVHIYAQCVCFMQYVHNLYFYTLCVFYTHMYMCTLQDTVCGEYISYSNTHCVWGHTHCVHGTMCAHMFMLHIRLFMSVYVCVCVSRHPDQTGLSDRGSHIGND